MTTAYPLTQLHQWMHTALQVANQALPNDVPVGAVGIIDGHVVATAHNTREYDHDPTGHAELNLIRAVAQQLGQWRLPQLTIVVTLEPCPMCAEALRQAKIGLVAYGAPDPLNGACGSKYGILPAPSDAVAVIGGLLEAECQTQLKAFFAQKRL
jgi:tRNA(adenine34) deaminase